MSTPPSGLRDDDDIFGDAEPRVSVEIDRDDDSQSIPGEADGRRPFTESDRIGRNGDPYASTYSSAEDLSGSSEPEPVQGVTHPTRRGSSARFLTDVIVDMGLTS